MQFIKVRGSQVASFHNRLGSPILHYSERWFVLMHRWMSNACDGWGWIWFIGSPTSLCSSISLRSFLGNRWRVIPHDGPYNSSLHNYHYEYWYGLIITLKYHILYSFWNIIYRNYTIVDVPLTTSMLTALFRIKFSKSFNGSLIKDS